MKIHILFILISASLLAAACAAPAQSPPVVPTAAAPTGDARIPVEALMNATYSGILDEPVTLNAGLGAGEPFVAGDPARPTVQYSQGAELYGDLDGDGVADALVFLVERGGGTAAITYVAAQLNRDGQPVDAGAVRIDEVQVKSAAIADGQVELEIITIGPGDADCCGSHKARRTYALQAGKLVEIAGEEQELVQISAADLDGTSWTLLELNDARPVLADVAVTVSFEGDQFSGSGGCNSFTGSFSLGDANPFVMTTSPVAATERGCPDPIAAQETAYFTALERVSQWGYEYGRLALYYADDQNGLSRLLFAPQTESQSEAFLAPNTLFRTANQSTVGSER